MTAVSKNVYFDVLNDIVDKYNNIKMKPIDFKSNSYADSYQSNSYAMLILMLKILNLKQGIMLK